MQALLEKFEYAEVIFGCEDIVDNNVAAIMAVEGKMVELITKNKSANLMARLMKEDKLKLYVSRDPFLFIARINEFLECIMISVPSC